MVVNGLIILSFLNLCMNKLNEVLGSNDVQQYEVTTSSDVNSVDNNTNKMSSKSSVTHTISTRRRVK